ncbi:MAG: hypothetical protein CMO80_19100 [Verrucomicrobiales bacterium]|nr:hypothetical protein [Verrucomicrobiales bacterium]|tara:strand:+ start:4777 stop:6444 length:1668 start_codon:yes stop_codon:yes gene_type:complete
MFRRKALDKLQSPESLDELLILVKPRAVFVLATLGVVFLVCLGWSIWAQIPTTVQGFGILLKPRSIKAIQSPGSGAVTDVLVYVGEFVEAGQPLIRVEQPELTRNLQQQISDYQAQKEFHTKILQLAKRRRDLEVELANQNLKDNEQSIISLEVLKQKYVVQMNEQKKQLKSIDALVEEGITSNSQRLNMRVGLTDSEQRMLRIEQELATLLNQKKQFRMQLQKAEQDYEIEVYSNGQTLEQMASSIRLNKERMWRQSVVRSRYQGKILEIAVSVGQVIGGASRVAILHIEPQKPFYRIELADDVGGGAYQLIYQGHETAEIPFDAKAPDILARLLELPPLRTQRESIRLEPGDTPRQFNLFLDFEEVTEADEDTGEGESLKIRDSGLQTSTGEPTFGIVSELGDMVPHEDLKHLGFLSIADGKKVKLGMDVRISPSNIERQRFGSMIGKVIDVSVFPVTSEGLINMIGNKEVVEALLQQGGTILVEASLEMSKENPERFQWTSKGPDQEITAGTTTTCRITVEQRRPITFAIPLLRKWILGEAHRVKPKTSTPP